MAVAKQGRLPAVDDYIAKAAPFAQPILLHLRAVVHEAAPGLVETMKWSRPFFVYQGVILGNMAAFKAHCSFGLWGEQIAGVVRESEEASHSGMGTFGKITDVGDLPPKKQLIRYVKLAAKAIGDGERTKAWSRPKIVKAEFTVPAALVEALRKTGLTAKFDAMAPSCRREYAQWISEAKREDTREKRIATSLEWIAEGKGRNWRYEKSSG